MKTNRTRQGKAPQTPQTPQRVFSIEHANRALPLVRRVVADAMAQHRLIAELEQEAQRDESGRTREQTEALRDRCSAAVDRVRELADELSEIGCLLKDAQRGLVDFPAMHEGRPVYLCWQFGEDHVSHWHELEAGFAGRSEIDAAFAAA